MKKLFLSFILCCICIATGFAQTLISATGDGGFENGPTAAANGWTIVNNATNAWYVGTVSPFAGTNCIYISNNSGTANAYNTGTVQTSHFYKDVFVPGGATGITLSFQLKSRGEVGWDRLAVFTAPTTVTPVAGVPASTSSALDPAITGATLVYKQTSIGLTTYTTVTQALPNSLAGTNVRIIFTWQNDGGGGTQPPASVDNISLVYTPAVACSGTPTAGTVVATPASGCGFYNSALTLSGSSLNSGLTYQWQSSADNASWSNVTGATNASYNAVVTSNIYYRAQVTCTGFGSTASTPGVQLTISPALSFATLPFTETFEPAWINACDIADVPNNFWRNIPFTGNASWRREDDATGPNTAVWGNNTSYSYNSYGSGSASAHSARFHQGFSTAGTQGKLDLYVNLPAGNKQINYDYISASTTTGANNSIQLQISVDGGATFNNVGAARNGTAGVWTTITENTTLSSPNAVIRWLTTSDYGSNDIGLDNVNVFLLLPCAAPTNQPTAINFTPSLTSISGSFTASVPAANKYLVIMTTTGVPPTSPADGTTYTVGATALGGTVVSNSNATTFTSPAGLPSGTQYWFWVYGYNTLCVGGPTYKASTPLSGSVATNVCNLSGTKTVGATGNYTTLTAAMTAIANNGLSGPLVLELQANYNSAGETYPIVINAAPCNSAASTLTIKPAAGVVATITGTSAAGGVLKLLNARNLIIDGVNTGGASLTITSTNTSGAGIWLASTAATGAGCSNITLANMNFVGASNTTASTWGIIACDNGSGPGNNTNAGDNDNITITGNTFTKSGYAVLAAGNTAISAGGNDNWVVNNNIAGPAVYNTAINLGVNGMYFQNMVNLQISGNTIQNVGISTSGTYGVAGLYLASGINRASVTGNTMINVSSSATTATNASYGMYVGGSVIKSIISKNTITGLHNDAGAGTMRAIQLSTSTAASNDTIVNNMISDIYAMGSTTLANNAMGIYLEGSTGGVSIWHNSVSFSVARSGSSGAVFSFPLYITTSGSGLDLRNNIFSNTYDNTNSTTERNYAIYNTAAASQFLFSDYNDYYVAGAQNVLARFGTVEYTTLAAIQTISGSNSHSVSANPSFTSNTNLHIPAGTASQLESGGMNVGVNTDFDNQARPGPALSVNGGATAPDMGADEFDGVIVDLIAPVINYTALTNSCNTADRIITATISDATGVNTSATLMPKIYFRKNTDPYVAAYGVQTSGNAISGVWSFTISATAVGGLAINDVVSYYIVAQDVVATPNVGATPGGGFAATNVNSITTPPTTPSTITVLNTLGGTYTVGAGAGMQYPSITAAVAAYNNSCLSGPVVFQLMDAAYSAGETFPITINRNIYSSTTNTLTIRPNTGINATITGLAASTAIFKLLNANNVVIDGINNGTTSLTLNGTNTGTFSDIWLASTAGTGPGCNNVTLKNMNINGGSNGTTSDWAIIAGVDGSSPGSGAGIDNDNITIQGNTIAKCGYAIYANGSSAVSAGGLDNWVINNNIVGPSAYNATTVISYNGMFLQNMLNLTVSGNTVQNVGITSGTSQTNGINLVSNINGATISQNNINNITSAQTSTVITGQNAALILGNNVINTTVTRNNIHTISNLATGGYGVRGIMINTGNGSSNIVLSNNAIANIFSYADAPVIYWAMGIHIEGSTGGVKLYYNSVSLASVFAGYTSATGSAALYVNTSGTNLDIRNNIFSNTYNNTVSSTDKGWGIYSTSTAAAYSAIDYNDYYAATPNVAGYIGSDRANLAAIQTGFGSNTHSLNIAPLFASLTDLRLQQVAANVAFLGSGTPIAGITTDLFGTTRNTSTPIIGAHEVNIPSCGSITAGYITAVNPVICVSGVTTVNAVSVTTGLGMSYQWQTSADSVTFTNVAGATNTSYVIPTAITANTYYRIIASCSISGNKDSATLKVRVTPLPVIAVTPDGGAYCSGNSLTIGASGAVSYVWTPSTGLSASNASVVTTTVTGTTVYTVTGTDVNGCMNTHVSTVTVTTTPAAPVITAATPVFCTGSSTMLTANGSGPATAFSDNFNAGLGLWNIDNAGSSNAAAIPNTQWNAKTSPYIYVTSTGSAQPAISSPDASQFAITNADPGLTGSTTHSVLTSPTISLANFTSATLTYQHYLRSLSTTDVVKVEISTNGGSTWATLQNYPGGTEVGTATSFNNASISLNSYTGNANVKIRFNYQSAWNWYWALDNVTIAGTATNNNITWAPGVGLYNDAALTSPYTGAATTTVYAAPTAVSVPTNNTYTATAFNGSCTASSSRTLTVNPAPAANTGNHAVCLNSSTTLTNTVTGGTWSTSSPNLSVPSAATGVINGVAVGTGTVTYTLGTGCNRVSVITVNALPAAITGNADACIGATNTLTSTTPGGIWSSSNTAVATISNVGGLTGVAAGNATISYTLANSCTTTVLATVNTLPVVAVTPTTNATVCMGSSFTFTASSPATGVSLLTQNFNGTIAPWIVVSTGVGNAAANWNINPAGTVVPGDGSPMLVVNGGASGGQAISNVTSPSFSTVGYASASLNLNQTVLSDGSDPTIKIEYSINNGSTWATMADYNVIGNVNALTGTWSAATPTSTIPLPAAAIGQGNVKIRFNYVGSSFYWAIDNINVSAVPPAATYTWAGAAGLSCVACGTTTITPTALGNNAYSVTATTSHGCVTTVPVTVSVNAMPSAISGASVVCEQSAITLSNTATGGTWTSSNTGRATVNPTTGVVTGVAAGTATISYTLNGGCFTTKDITVNLTPAAITGTAVVCAGLTTTLGETTTGGTWSSSVISVATVNNAGVVTGVAQGNADIAYIMPTGCKAVVTVTVNPTPGAISGTLAVCEGATTALGNSLAGGTWASSNNAVATIDVSTGVVTGIIAGTATITYAMGTGCQNIAVVTVNTTPTPIAGVPVVCEQSTTVLSDATSIGIWTSSNMSVATVNNIGVVTGNNTGVATITYTLMTGCFATQEVTVNTTPPVITGDMYVCEGSTTPLANTMTGGEWTSANSAVAAVDVTTGVVTGVLAGTTNITYAITATGCYAKTIVTVNAQPAVNTGIAAVCEGATTTLGNTVTGGTWTSSNTTVATVAGTTGVVTGVAAGNATITYMLPAGCMATTDVTVNLQPAAITGTLAICRGTTTTLTNTVAGGEWTSSAPAIAAVDPVTGEVAGIAGGTATITYAMPEGCNTTAVMTVNFVSEVYTVTGTGHYCANGEGLTVGLSGSDVNSTYQLYNGAATVGTAVAGIGSAISFGTYTGAGTYTVVANNGSSCANNMAGDATITIDALPGIYDVAGTGNYCAATGGHVTLNGSDNNAAINYDLYHSGTLVNTLTGTGIALDFGAYTVAGTYTVQATNTSTGCTSPMNLDAVISITPDVVPVVTVAQSTNPVICAGSAVTLTATPVHGGTAPVYTWLINGTATSTTGNTYTYVPANGDVVKTVLHSNEFCALPDSAVTTNTLTVTPVVTPSISINATPGVSVCRGTTVTFTSSSINGGTAAEYTWVVNGSIVSTASGYSYTPANGDIVYAMLSSHAYCVTDTNVYSNNLTMNVDSGLIPIVNIDVLNGTFINVGQADTFVAKVTNAGNNPSYKWYRNGVLIPTATTAMYWSNTLANNDSIAVVVTASGPCGYSSFNSVIIKVKTTGVVAVPTVQSDLRMVPNPTSGMFVVSGTLGATTDELVNFEITDMLGQVVYRGQSMTKAGAVNEKIQVSNTLANGMYMLNVKTATDNKVFHFVLKQ